MHHGIPPQLHTSMFADVLHTELSLAATPGDRLSVPHEVVQIEELLVDVNVSEAADEVFVANLEVS